MVPTLQGHLKIGDNLKCLRNLYAVQEATVRTGQVTTNWFKVQSPLGGWPCVSLMFAAWLKMESSSVSSFIRTGHETTHWFQIRKGVCQGCILSPCLFNLYAEYIMRNAGLDELQAGIKISGRNINNLRYADDITLMAESEEELKSLLMKVKRRMKKLA